MNTHLLLNTYKYPSFSYLNVPRVDMKLVFNNRGDHRILSKAMETDKRIRFAVQNSFEKLIASKLGNFTASSIYGPKEYLPLPVHALSVAIPGYVIDDVLMLCSELFDKKGFFLVGPWQIFAVNEKIAREMILAYAAVLGSKEYPEDIPMGVRAGFLDFGKTIVSEVSLPKNYAYRRMTSNPPIILTSVNLSLKLFNGFYHFCLKKFAKKTRNISIPGVEVVEEDEIDIVKK